MTIYDVLMSDHREVIGLLKKAEKAEGEERQALLTTIIDALTAHAIAEGEVLYDAVENASDDVHELIMEAHEEHLSAARLMKELLDPAVNDERRLAKTTLLREQIEHHVEEEEGEMFTKCRRLINADAAEALAGEFLVKKEQLMTRPIADRVAEAIATEEALARGGAKKNKSPKKVVDGVDGVKAAAGLAAR